MIKTTITEKLEIKNINKKQKIIDEGIPVELMQAMYSQKTIKKEKTPEDLMKASYSSRDSYLMEIRGQKVHIPTMTAHQKLLEEHERLKKEHIRLKQESTRMFVVIKQLSKAINEINDELKQKIDRYDD